MACSEIPEASMRKRRDSFKSFLTGLGVAAVAVAVMIPVGRKTRRRAAKIAQRVGRTLKIKEAAYLAKKAMGTCIETSRGVAHATGKKMEQGGRRLQGA